MRYDRFSLKAEKSQASAARHTRRANIVGRFAAALTGLMLCADLETARAQFDDDDVFEIRSAEDEDFVPFDGLEVAGAQFPHLLETEDVTLHLAGAGARKQSRLVMYSMGFYVSDANRPADELIDADEPAVIRMEAVSSLITPVRFAKAVTRGFEKSTKGNPGQFDAEIGQFLAALKGRLKRGEVMDLIYSPGVGTTILRNGEHQTTVQGLEFKQALFRIWLGEDPIDVALKEELLSGVE